MVNSRRVVVWTGLVGEEDEWAEYTCQKHAGILYNTMYAVWNWLGWVLCKYFFKDASLRIKYALALIGKL